MAGYCRIQGPKPDEVADIENWYIGCGKWGVETCPEWFSDILLAKYIGIPAHEVADLPVLWKRRYQIAMEIQAKAEKQWRQSPPSDL